MAKTYKEGNADKMPFIVYTDEQVTEIDPSQIPDGSITSAKIENDAVTGGKIADGAVTTEKVSDGAITSAKIDGDVLAILEKSTTITELKDADVATAKSGFTIESRKAYKCGALVLAICKLTSSAQMTANTQYDFADFAEKANPVNTCPTINTATGGGYSLVASTGLWSIKPSSNIAANTAIWIRSLYMADNV